MTDFVLVPGGGRGGWCYGRVAAILRAEGHRVSTPTLTGLGERSHLASLDINCSTHIQDVLNVIKWERLEEVVLCGHSYGGMVIGAVADRIPERVAALVYLDAAIPENGKSLADLLGDPSWTLAFVDDAARNGGSMLTGFDEDAAALFNGDPADRELMAALCTPHPVATCFERLTLTGRHDTIPKKTFVLATDWDNRATRPFYERVKDDESWTVFEVACGHDVMLNAPERLAEILLGAS